MLNGYSLISEDLKCQVFEEKSKKNLLVEIPVGRNKIPPLRLNVDEKQASKAFSLDGNWL